MLKQKKGTKKTKHGQLLAFS